jgi:hypothetical protein
VSEKSNDTSTKTHKRPPEPKYALNERVKCLGWGGSDFGTIVGIRWIYHMRLFEYTWGYKINWENNGPGLSFEYVPEGYLRKIAQQEEPTVNIQNITSSFVEHSTVNPK